FKKVVKDVQVPGFRKGKVPRKIFEGKFGVESLYQDAVDIVLPDAYRQAAEETEIVPVDQPEVDIEQIEQGKELVFTAEVTVKPEVELGEYKGLEVEEETVEVTDEDVEHELEHLRQNHAELIDKENGADYECCTLVIDFEGCKDGEAFEGGKRDNYPLASGSGKFTPGFADILVGCKAWEEADIRLSFPEE